MGQVPELGRHDAFAERHFRAGRSRGNPRFFVDLRLHLREFGGANLRVTDNCVDGRLVGGETASENTERSPTHARAETTAELTRCGESRGEKSAASQPDAADGETAESPEPADPKTSATDAAPASEILWRLL